MIVPLKQYPHYIPPAFKSGPKKNLERSTHSCVVPPQHARLSPSLSLSKVGGQPPPLMLTHVQKYALNNDMSFLQHAGLAEGTDIGEQGEKSSADIKVQAEHFQNTFIWATRPVTTPTLSSSHHHTFLHHLSPRPIHFGFGSFDRVE